MAIETLMYLNSNINNGELSICAEHLHRESENGKFGLPSICCAWRCGCGLQSRTATFGLKDRCSACLVVRTTSGVPSELQAQTEY